MGYNQRRASLGTFVQNAGAEHYYEPDDLEQANSALYGEPASGRGAVVFPHDDNDYGIRAATRRYALNEWDLEIIP